MQVDLRSDTVTRPTPGMFEAMMSAKVGDDVFGEDPSINELERKAASLFGKEAALFCPSGTMTNQVAVKVLTSPGEEIICERTAHVFLYEAGGLAFNSGLSMWLLDGDRGRLKAVQIKEAIRPDNVHYPQTTLVSIENTHNRGGGSIYELKEIEAIRKVCNEKNLKFHLDGARIFNALAEASYNAMDMGNNFDTISMCLSKGLGAPVGSLLISDEQTIHRARRIRKVFGGGMRQAGFLAAAGIYALDNHIERLKEDHKRAKVLEGWMKSLPFVNDVMSVSTNIVVSRLDDGYPLEKFITDLENKNIRVVPFGPQAVRMVTHLDFNDDMLEYTGRMLKML